MQQARSQTRAPGSFSPLTSTNPSRPPLINKGTPRATSFLSDEAPAPAPSLSLSRSPSRNPTAESSTSTGIYPGISPTVSPAVSPALSPASSTSAQPRPGASPTVHQSSASAGSSSSSLCSKPTIPRACPSSPATAAAVAARSGILGAAAGPGAGSGSPLAATASPSIASSACSKGVHHRKYSQTQGHFEPTLPSAGTSNLRQHHREHKHPQQHQQQSPFHVGLKSKANPDPSALAAAAQAAMQHKTQHLRQRSQTVPTPGTDNLSPPYEPSSKLRGVSASGGKGPLSAPMLSLTEASAPRESGFGNQSYRNGLLGSHSVAATTAANVVFQRPNMGAGSGGQASPSLSTQAPVPAQLNSEREKERDTPKAKPEKSRKLFGRPGKIIVKGEAKEKPYPSPSKIGAALSSLQRSNFSTTSLVDSGSSGTSLYNLANSSSATIRALDSAHDSGSGMKEGKETKEKKHHFLSRGKHKLSSKDSDYHSILSSSSSNSKPTGPHAPSIYNFNVPPSSPGPTTTSFKAGLDLRHAGRNRDKRREERCDSRDHDDASSIHAASEWPGPSSYSSLSGQNSLYMAEPLDPGKYGLNNMTLDDAWPYLKAKLLVVFQGEDLRLPVEDFNRVVTMHIQYCVQRRSPQFIVEDLRDLLTTGFSSLDQALGATTEDRLIPDLVELWIFTFTGLVPYLQAVFLPLDLEFAGNGTLLTPDQARDFWGGIFMDMTTSSTTSSSSPTDQPAQGHRPQASTTSILNPFDNVLDVRRLVLAAYRDAVILPRYDTLRHIFSRLSLEFLPMSIAALQSPPPGPIPIAGANGATGFGFGVDSSSSNPFSTSPATASEPTSLSMMAGAHAGSFGSMMGPHPRPGTAMSSDPSLGSYNSTGTTLLGGEASSNSNSQNMIASQVAAAATTTTSQILSGSRSRAISNVSFGSNLSAERPYTPGGGGPGVISARDNVEDSKQVTEMVGRMLQCMSVLAGVGVGGEQEEGNRKIGELCRLLKLNWLGRGRTGRNRRGIVGGKVRRAVGTGQLEVRV